MKKFICLLLTLSVVFAFFAACSKGNENTGTQTTASSASQSGNTDSTAKQDDNTTVSALAVTIDTSVDADKQKRLEDLKQYDVDIDLTTLNTTMLQARVNEILENPNDYKGKTVRVTGSYNKSYYDQTDKYYDYVLGYDQTMCCAAWGIEFMGDCVPEDIEQYTTIGLVGTFDFYEELGQTYFYINVDHCVV